MDLDWCIVCDRHTSGGIYCSQTCRNKDTPQELQGRAPVVPGPLDQKKLAFPLGMTGRKTTSYGYNYSSNEDDSSDSDDFGLGNNNKNNTFYFPTTKATQNDKLQQPKKDLLVSYGALTSNIKTSSSSSSNQASHNLKFLPRQSHRMNFQEQTARIF